MIDKRTEERIKGAAKIADVLRYCGVELRPQGANFTALCPFHEDKRPNNFIVSPSKNICSCYSCGKTGLDPIATMSLLKFASLPEKEAYKASLREIAKIYGIYVDDAPQAEYSTPSPLPPIVTKLEPVMWSLDLATPFARFNDQNPLLKYLVTLKLTEGDRKRMEKALQLYLVGTYPNGQYAGWTIWWYIDNLGYVRTGKMMPYKEDGHRDKQKNSTWVHSQLQKQGKFDRNKQCVNICLFGQHLLDLFPQAYVRIVESEKTAVICSAFTNPEEVIWLASGGLSMMNDQKLLTLLKKGRTVELYPDYDGYGSWSDKISVSKELQPYIASGKLRVSEQVRELWREEDGPKADIADIMVRIINTPKTTTYSIACARLGLKEHEPLKNLINNLGLEIE